MDKINTFFSQQCMLKDTQQEVNGIQVLELTVKSQANTIPHLSLSVVSKV